MSRNMAHVGDIGSQGSSENSIHDLPRATPKSILKQRRHSVQYEPPANAHLEVVNTALRVSGGNSPSYMRPRRSTITGEIIVHNKFRRSSLQAPISTMPPPATVEDVVLPHASPPINQRRRVSFTAEVPMRTAAEILVDQHSLGVTPNAQVTDEISRQQLDSGVGLSQVASLKKFVVAAAASVASLNSSNGVLRSMSRRSSLTNDSAVISRSSTPSSATRSPQMFTTTSLHEPTIEEAFATPTLAGDCSPVEKMRTRLQLVGFSPRVVTELPAAVLQSPDKVGPLSIKSSRAMSEHWYARHCILKGSLLYICCSDTSTTAQTVINLAHCLLDAYPLRRTAFALHRLGHYKMYVLEAADSMSKINWMEALLAGIHKAWRTEGLLTGRSGSDFELYTDQFNLTTGVPARLSDRAQLQLVNHILSQNLPFDYASRHVHESVSSIGSSFHAIGSLNAFSSTIKSPSSARTSTRGSGNHLSDPTSKSHEQSASKNQQVQSIAQQQSTVKASMSPISSGNVTPVLEHRHIKSLRVPSPHATPAVAKSNIVSKAAIATASTLSGALTPPRFTDDSNSSQSSNKSSNGHVAITHGDFAVPTDSTTASQIAAVYGMGDPTDMIERHRELINSKLYQLPRSRGQSTETSRHGSASNLNSSNAANNSHTFRVATEPVHYNSPLAKHDVTPEQNLIVPPAMTSITGGSKQLMMSGLTAQQELIGREFCKFL